jgi:hypothetical protein
MWSRFEEKGDSWILVLPPYYAWLFRYLDPHGLTWRSNTGFRPTKKGNNEFAFFPDLDESDVETIQSFIDDFRRYVLLGPNTEAAGQFANGLDFCLALDFNSPSPEAVARRERTSAGELEFQAKYKRCARSRAHLAEELAAAFARVPLPDTGSTLVTCVPCAPGRDFYLPDLDESRPELELLTATLRRPKRALKDCSIDEKLREWDDLLREEEIDLSSEVDGQVVVVLDDLYQSGTSIWAYGQFLKSAGASHVLGMVCVKSLRSTDNV